MAGSEKERMDRELQPGRARRRGRTVYSLDWDNAWGGGTTWVVRWRGRFYAFSDDVEAGPYPTFAEALAAGPGEFGDGSIDISCAEMPAEQLVGLLVCHADGRHAVR